jgi:ribosome maturation factor RimP
VNKHSLTQLVSPIVEGLGLEVDRVEVRAAGRRELVQIFLDGDGADGLGPSLDDIAAATRAVSKALDEADSPSQRPYTLEVSSRGVNRPLVEPKHFRRNRGRLVRIELADGPVCGRVLDAADTLVLDVDGVAAEYPWPLVGAGQVQVELNRLPQDQE